MLCAMYFAQGVPWGFMVTALIAYLTDEKGVGDSQAGALTAIVLLPWTFKIVWGPIIDSVTIRSMGRRRPWIIFAELMMAVSLLGILMLGDLSNNLRLLGWMFFLHNCFASLQDVATDALALDVLPPNEQGRVNGMMWCAKLVGKAIGASVMALIISAWGLPAAVFSQFGILIIIMFFPLLLLERPGEKRFPWSRPVTLNQVGRADPEVPLADAANVRNPLKVLGDLYKGFSLASTSVFFVFGVVGLVGWGIIEVITKPLYTQQLGWDFVQFSHITALAVIPEMAGAILGGYMADRFGSRPVMVIGLLSYAILSATFAGLPGMWHESWFAGGFLFLYPGFLAVGSVGFLAMSMRISWTNAAATMFTVYMTASNIGHVIGNWLVKILRDDWSLSYSQTMWCAAILLGLPLLLLLVVDPKKVDEAKQRIS